ncbi:MAG: ABC transporter ATP-binding protein [Bacteroidota bacterium]
MKTYLRLLSYAKPFYKFIIPYLLFSLASICFGLVNFSMLIPTLNLLFKTLDTAALQKMAVEPHFDLAHKIDYITSLFNYYLSNQVLTNGRTGALAFVCGVLVVSVMCSAIFTFLASSIIETLRTGTVSNLRRELFQKISSMHLGYFSNERKGDIISRITVDVREVESSVANTLSVIMKEPITIAFYLGVLIYISGKLTLFTLLIIPVSGGLIGLITKNLRREAREGQDSLGRMMSILDESLGGMRVIKAFNGTGYIRRKFFDEDGFYTRLIRKTSIRREAAGPTSEFLGSLMIAGIILYGGKLVLDPNPELDAGAFLTYVVIFSQVMRPAKALSGAFGSVQRGLASGERIFKILDEVNQVTDKVGAVPLADFSDCIELKNVSFAYGKSTVLHNVSFKLPKGKTIALVGPSGGGKSTIADLIPRFYDVTAGQVLIDGKDVRDYDIESVRAQMGVVTQESVLFNDTIFNNIAFAKTDATKEEVYRAAAIANAHEFIIKSEHGYDTIIGDRGVKLSGGQRQRLSIARAVLKNPAILILDEATSALDTESEMLVQDALAKLMENRTSLVIAHRLSTIQSADSILVLQSGSIVEEGTHISLLNDEKGLYRKLNRLQAF